jgi:hypothetical protein
LKAVTYAFPPGYRENAEEEEEGLINVKIHIQGEMLCHGDKNNVLLATHCSG